MPTPESYTIGAADPRQQGHATLETKPPAYTDGRRDSGAGYERWRSYEFRPHTARQGKEDVYVPVHRLTAVVSCFDSGTPLSCIFETLDGADVHHESGIPFDNRPDNLTVVDHGTHSEVTQAQMRAWGEDSKRQARDETPAERAVCGRCGDEADVMCESSDFEGERCLACAKVDNDGATLEVV